jgi:phosphatidylserine synthase
MFGKMSETVERFYFVVSITRLSRFNIEKNDGDGVDN